MGITWTRLNDGSWGLRGPSTHLKKGAVVEVASKDGRTTQVIVARIVRWLDGTTVIAEAAPLGTKVRRSI
jgi:hypothetical protein